MSTPDPDITRLLDRLEGHGFIRRRRERRDRRVVRTQITEQGLGVLEKLDGLVSELQTRHLGHFDTRELNTLRALLRVTEQAS